MSNPSIKAMVKALDKRMTELAKVRDKIEDDISTFESLREDANEAFDELQLARDALSRLV
jgi:predicted  nucleic acid-binding Zn-ribbon protein